MQSAKLDRRLQYEILSLIGNGTYSNVYKAIFKPDGKIVAVKIIDISEMDRDGIDSVLNEIRILSSISNPHVVEYYEAFVDPKERHFWIVMEHLGGGDLASMITRHQKDGTMVEEQQLWAYMVQVLRGINELHKLKIVHRDIKPANIFLTDDLKNAKIGDLNVSKVLKQDLTRTQIGTPYYLAPEIWNKKAYDYRADIFSLGALLYELAALRHPHEAKTSNELHRKLMNDEIDRIPQAYSEELSTIIMKCMAKEQMMRPTAEQLLNSKIVKQKIVDLELDQNAQTIDDPNFLSATIIVPKKLSLLNKKLPQRATSRNNSCRNAKIDSNGLTNELTNDSIKSHKVAKVTVREIKKPSIVIANKKDISIEPIKKLPYVFARRTSNNINIRSNSKPTLLSRENSIKRPMLTDRSNGKLVIDRIKLKTSVEQLVRKCPETAPVTKRAIAPPINSVSKPRIEIKIEKLKNQPSGELKPLVSERANPPLKMPKHLSGVYMRKISDIKIDKPEIRKGPSTSINKNSVVNALGNRRQSPRVAKYTEHLRKVVEKDLSPKRIQGESKRRSSVNRSCA